MLLVLAVAVASRVLPVVRDRDPGLLSLRGFVFGAADQANPFTMEW